MQQFATFSLNAELFGLNILQVQEIQMPQPVTPVPRSAGHIMGLIGLRGTIVTLIDLRRRLNMDTGRPIDHPYHIVVSAASNVACFEVDQIGDVIDAPDEVFAPPPESVRAVDAKFLDGVFTLDHRIVSVLNVDSVLQIA